ncbi:N-terminal acetyltransferase A, auxiliary subunit [Aureobasidium pullulans]|nr:N-terminal acetyltransferase A, auxiliary subunit [Aureobasidium pullulans]
MSVPLSSKEQSLFKQVVQLYESKQYKRGIKTADQVLKKVPNHGDTQAMKALILNSQGKTEEAFDLAKLALKNAMKSNVCWHVYGLLYRSVKNYDEAIKAYKFALRLDPESRQIQRDLALLQAQTRDWKGLVDSRKTMVTAAPSVRANWTAFAIAHHMAADYQAAEKVLTTYEGTLKNPPPATDLEHHEAVLYKNTIIAESGDYERALEGLKSIYRSNPDRTAVMELRAEYLLKLGRKEEAEKAYRALLERNAERRAYYDGLEQALGLDRNDSAQHTQLQDLYKSFAEKSERIDAPRRVPLDFLQGDAFKEAADVYLTRVFRKGVPSTFANVKALYNDESKKQTIEQLVLGYASQNNEENGKNWDLAVNYFLAQHYDYHLCRNLEKASEYIEKTISLNTNPQDYTFHLTKARITKHSGDLEKASKQMNEAREMDRADRYINTKCAKYQLRNDQNDDAINTMGLFTRKEANGGPLGDLLDMQCMWYLFEDGEAYKRQNKLGLALKRFKSIHDIFDVWFEDQFDFHSFSLRKGMIRAYVDMIRWEDHLRQHPFYSRAAYSAIDIYVKLFDDPNYGSANGDLSDADKKKAEKKARKDKEKAEADKKAAAAAKATAASEEVVKKEDTDPQGEELLKTKDPLSEAMKYLSPLLAESPLNIRSQQAGFEVFIRREKYLPALKCLVAASKIDNANSLLKEQTARLRKTLAELKEPLPEKIKEVIDAELATLP